MFRPNSTRNSRKQGNRGTNASSLRNSFKFGRKSKGLRFSLKRDDTSFGLTTPKDISDFADTTTPHAVILALGRDFLESLVTSTVKNQPNMAKNTARRGRLAVAPKATVKLKGGVIMVPKDFELSKAVAKTIRARINDNIPGNGTVVKAQVLQEKEMGMASVLFTLLSLVQQPQHAKAFAKSSKVVLRAIKHFSWNAKISYFGCCILNKLLSEDEVNQPMLRKSLLDHDFVNIVAQTMEAHPKLPSIQSVCCRLLWGCLDHGGDAPEKVDSFVLEKVLDAMELFSDELGVQSEACNLLQRLAVEQENEKLIGHLGGLELTLAAIAPERLRLKVVKKATSALFNLTFATENRKRLIEKGGKDVLCNVLKGLNEGTKKAPIIVSKILGILWNLCDFDFEDSKVQMFEGVLPELVLTTMNIMRSESKVQEMGCGCLGSLAYNDGTRIRLMNMGAGDKVIESMQDFVKEKNIQIQAFSVIKKLSCNLDNERELINSGAAKRVLDAMDLHYLVAGIQERALRVLWNLSASDVHKKRLIEAGCTPRILRAMKQHLNSESLQYQALRLLKRLGVLPESRVLFVKNGVHRQVVAILGELQSSRIVSEKGCEVLTQLLIDDVTSRQLMSLGVVEQLLATMEVHRYTLTVQERCCAMLWKLAQVSENRGRLVELGLIERVVDVLDVHFDNSDLVQLICVLLSNVALNDNNKLKLLNFQAEDKIVKIIRRHRHNAEIVHSALGILYQLSKRRVFLDKLSYASSTEKSKVESFKVVQELSKQYGHAPTSRSKITPVSNQFLMAEKGAPAEIALCLRVHRGMPEVVYKAMASLNCIAQDPRSLSAYLADRIILEEMLFTADLYEEDLGVKKHFVSVMSRILENTSLCNGSSSKNKLLFPDLHIRDDILAKSSELMLKFGQQHENDPFFQLRTARFFHHMYELVSMREVDYMASIVDRSVQREKLYRIHRKFSDNESNADVQRNPNFFINLKANQMHPSFVSPFVSVLTTELLEGFTAQMVVFWRSITGSGKNKILKYCVGLFRRMIKDNADFPSSQLFEDASKLALSYPEVVPMALAATCDVSLSTSLRTRALWVIRLFAQFGKFDGFRAPFHDGMLRQLTTTIKATLNDREYSLLGIITFQYLLKFKEAKEDGGVGLPSVKMLVEFVNGVFRSTVLLKTTDDKTENVIRALLHFMESLVTFNKNFLSTFIGKRGGSWLAEVMRLCAQEDNLEFAFETISLLLTISQDLKAQKLLIRAQQFDILFKESCNVLLWVLKRGFDYNPKFKNEEFDVAVAMQEPTEIVSEVKYRVKMVVGRKVDVAMTRYRTVNPKATAEMVMIEELVSRYCSWYKLILQTDSKVIYMMNHNDYIMQPLGFVSRLDQFKGGENYGLLAEQARSTLDFFAHYKEAMLEAGDTRRPNGIFNTQLV